ncbi:MAG: tRNA (adenosine(37)-N6)-dimethylallyltransferase MiaA [Phycisphaerae bacterium]|nr:tRNA (adenosine(37)-N6)-dimethylallyltransferase MiaA [Phycisphaerae bacterium]
MNEHILILGVTGSGKGRLAFELARERGAEIISVDSMKVYRRMDIGTAKPPIEKRAQMPYHLIDVAEPSEAFSVGRFLELAEDAAKEIGQRGKPVIASGGTALYIKAMLYGLFEGPGGDAGIREKLKAEAGTIGLEELHRRLEKVDPATAQRIHRNDERRIVRALEVYELTGRPISDFQNQWDEQKQDTQSRWKVIGIRRDKQAESSRINKRVKRMIDEGLVDEVKGLLAEPKQLSVQAAAAIGYAEIIAYFNGELTLDEAIEKIKINTRRLAKHQRTWFKTFGEVGWIDVKENDTAETVLEKAKAILDF